jgi:pilus assembly protein Flp/PilA
MQNFIRNFIADESGATAIEYGLLASLIAVVIIAGASVLGTNINTLFNDIATCIATPKSCKWASTTTP